MTYKWAVIGAGPAGIAAVGRLIDHDVPAKDIVWCDPEFKVGDFGEKWRNVSSNTKVDLFEKFLCESNAFEYSKCKHRYELHELDPQGTCDLQYMADPLAWVSERLQQKVKALKAKIHSLELKDRLWHLKNENETIQAQNCIIAIGADDKQLNYNGVETIPLTTALDNAKLKNTVTDQDTVAVFGASHSSIMAIRKLVDVGVKRIVNFYLHPCRYATYLYDWILFDDTGLKGSTATWARQHIDGTWPENLERYYSDETNINKYLPQCNKAIYGIGLKPRRIPVIGFPNLAYNKQSGIIAPGLFGFGVAYPEEKTNRFGTQEMRVGLWKFMDYLNRVLPIWLKYHT